MHRASTFLPQLFHSRWGSRVFAAFAALCVLAVGALSAQTIDAGAAFRVFLKDGRSLPSVGEYVLAGDRVVFTMAIGGAGAKTEMPFMSLPASSVDLDRTAAYARAVRRAYYAATTGEADFQALSADVAHTLEAIKTTADRRQRLDMAMDARRRLLDWSQQNYGYRAADVRELASQFDVVIASLRTQAGEPAASLDLMSSDAGEARVEVLQPAMGLRESIEAALFAASSADDGADRETVLRAAQAVLASSPLKADTALASSVSEQLNQEIEADRAYSALSTDVLGRADAAMRAGDVRAAEALQPELAARGRALGLRRPADVQALSDALAAKVEATRAYRLALDHYALVRPKLLRYERDVRGVISGLDGVKPVLDAIRAMHGAPGYHYLDLADERLQKLEAELPTIAVPDDLVVRQVQATLLSAVRMAREACARQRRVLVARNADVAREGSSAAMAAEMLADRARADLVARLYPPHAGQS